MTYKIKSLHQKNNSEESGSNHHTEEYFWCGVGKTATAGLEALARVKLVGEPEVGEFDHA